MKRLREIENIQKHKTKSAIADEAKLYQEFEYEKEVAKEEIKTTKEGGDIWQHCQKTNYLIGNS